MAFSRQLGVTAASLCIISFALFQLCVADSHLQSGCAERWNWLIYPSCSHCLSSESDPNQLALSSQQCSYVWLREGKGKCVSPYGSECTAPNDESHISDKAQAHSLNEKCQRLIQGCLNDPSCSAFYYDFGKQASGGGFRDPTAYCSIMGNCPEDYQKIVQCATSAEEKATCTTDEDCSGDTHHCDTNQGICTANPCCDDINDSNCWGCLFGNTSTSYFCVTYCSGSTAMPGQLCQSCQGLQNEPSTQCEDNFGVSHYPGELWTTSCESCYCMLNGQITCISVAVCDIPQCPVDYWRIPQGECCAKCNGCEDSWGNWHNYGEHFTSPDNEYCMCHSSGEIDCNRPGCSHCSPSASTSPCHTSPSPSNSPCHSSPSPTPSPCHPSSSASYSATKSASVSYTPTSSVSHSKSQSASYSRTSSASYSVSPCISQSSSSTASYSASQSASYSVTPSASYSMTPCLSSSVSSSASLSASSSASYSTSPSASYSTTPCVSSSTSASYSRSASRSRSASASYSKSKYPSHSASKSPCLPSTTPSYSPSASPCMPSRTPSATYSPSKSPCMSTTESATYSPSASASATPSASYSTSVSPCAPSSSPSPTTSYSTSPCMSVSASYSRSRSASPIKTPCLSSSVSQSAVPSYSRSPSRSGVPCPSRQPSPSKSPATSCSESPSKSPMPCSPTVTPTISACSTPSASYSASPTVSPCPQLNCSVDYQFLPENEKCPECGCKNVSGGGVLPPGTHWDTMCSTCYCSGSGELHCIHVECPNPSCPVEFQSLLSGECCPRCVGCKDEWGHWHKYGAKFSSHGKDCKCLPSGYVICYNPASQSPSPSPCMPSSSPKPSTSPYPTMNGGAIPSPSPCPKLNCSLHLQFTPENETCPQCGCHDEYGLHALGDAWKHDCEVCTCNSTYAVYCRSVKCQLPPCPEALQYVKPGECCPRCRGCGDENGDWHDIGESWESGCKLCECTTSGQVSCVDVECPVLNCSPETQEWPEDQCCPICTGCANNNSTIDSCQFLASLGLCHQVVPGHYDHSGNKLIVQDMCRESCGCCESADGECICDDNARVATILGSYGVNSCRELLELPTIQCDHWVLSPLLHDLCPCQCP